MLSFLELIKSFTATSIVKDSKPLLLVIYRPIDPLFDLKSVTISTALETTPYQLSPAPDNDLVFLDCQALSCLYLTTQISLNFTTLSFKDSQTIEMTPKNESYYIYEGFRARKVSYNQNTILVLGERAVQTYRVIPRQKNRSAVFQNYSGSLESSGVLVYQREAGKKGQRLAGGISAKLFSMAISEETDISVSKTSKNQTAFVVKSQDGRVQAFVPPEKPKIGLKVLNTNYNLSGVLIGFGRNESFPLDELFKQGGDGLNYPLIIILVIIGLVLLLGFLVFTRHKRRQKRTQNDRYLGADGSMVSAGTRLSTGSFSGIGSDELEDNVRLTDERKLK